MKLEIEVQDEVKRAIEKEVQKQLKLGGLFTFIKNIIKTEVDRKWSEIGTSLNSAFKRVEGLRSSLKENCFKRVK